MKIVIEDSGLARVPESPLSEIDPIANINARPDYDPNNRHCLNLMRNAYWST